MLSGRRYGSTDIQYVLSRSDHDIDLRLNLQHDGQIIVHSVHLDNRNTMMAKWMSCLYWVKSYYRKTFVAKHCYFWSFFSLEAKPLILYQIFGQVNERTLKELSNALLRNTVALLVAELCASLSKNVEIGHIWPLETSGDLTFDLT